MDNFEEELKGCQIRWLIQYIANVINIYCKYCGKELDLSYNQLFNSCFDKFNYSEKELEAIYQAVDDVLNRDYNLLIANKDKLVLVDLTEQAESEVA